MTNFCKELMGFCIARGDFVLGGFWFGGILSQGILARGDFVRGDFVRGDFDRGDFVQGDFVLSPVPTLDSHRRDPLRPIRAAGPLQTAPGCSPQFSGRPPPPIKL